MEQFEASSPEPPGAPNSEMERQLRLSSAQAVLFSQAVADRLGLTSTELESMDFFNLYGPLTAGRLAELTGLSTGGITRLLDRLERKGYVRREADPSDRRKVIVHLVGGAEIGAYFESLSAKMQALIASYDDSSLAAIVTFLTRGNELVREEIASLRAGDGFVPPLPPMP